MRRRPDRPESLVPLMAAEMEVLVSLADSRRHAYGVLSEIRRRTRGGFDLGVATLYATLNRLASFGLLQSEIEARPGKVARRVYEITDTGKRILRLESDRLTRLLNDAARKSTNGVGH